MQHNKVVPRKEVRGLKAHGRAVSTKRESSGTYGPKAFLDQVFVITKPNKKQEASTQPANVQTITKPKSVDELIAQNPGMNAATFWNLIKSEFPAARAIDQVKEADSASAFPQALRAKESRGIGFKVRNFLESAVQVDPKSGLRTRYKVVMLEEGMGNFGASAYYSAEALRSAISIFEGKKIYADHPKDSDEVELPERSVRDILGHFENVHVAESNGRHSLCGDLIVMGGESFQWARELMEHAVAYSKQFPDKEFVGLSINASGDSEALPLEEVVRKGIPESAMSKIQEAKAQGISELTYVSRFTDAVSCDLVTEAGAGGKILGMIESARQMKESATEGGPGSGPQGGTGSKAIDDRKAAQDKANNQKQYDKIYSKNKNEREDSMSKKDEKKMEGADDKMAADAAKDGHADAAQDMDLIKKMIAKHGGASVSDEEAAIVKEAYEAHKEMGCKDEEAESGAVGFLKASKHMAGKREAAAKEAEAKAAQEASAGSQGGEDDKKVESTESVEGKESSVKESAAAAKKDGEKSEVETLREENARLKGEQAAFKESEKKNGLKAHIEKICKESKLHNSVTADFKKLVESAKSVEEVDKTWSVFQEGYRSRKSGTEGLDFGGMVVDVEKSSFQESAGQQGGLDLGACVTED